MEGSRVADPDPHHFVNLDPGENFFFIGPIWGATIIPRNLKTKRNKKISR
jgi:hypothetical protein